MAATLEIRELPKGLSLRVTEPKRVGRILFSAVFGVAGTLFFIYVPSSTLLKIFLGGFCIFSLIRSLISGLRGADVELVVTNLDFKSAGHAPEGYKPSTTARADIYNMEFREASGDSDSPECRRDFISKATVTDGFQLPVSCLTSTKFRPNKSWTPSIAASRTPAPCHRLAHSSRT